MNSLLPSRKPALCRGKSVRVAAAVVAAAVLLVIMGALSVGSLSSAASVAESPVAVHPDYRPRQPEAQRATVKDKTRPSAGVATEAASAPAAADVVPTAVPPAAVPLPQVLSTPLVQRVAPFSKYRFVYAIRATKPRHVSHLQPALSSWATDVPEGRLFLATDSLDDIPAHWKSFALRLSKEPNHDFGRKGLRVLATFCEYRNRGDFFVYVDDSTFVSVANLEGLVEDLFSPAAPLYGGCAFLDNPVPLVSVGGGMVFSRATLDAVCSHVSDENHVCSWLNEATYQTTGDAAIAQCMQSAGIPARHIHGFNQMTLQDITAPPGEGGCQVEWLPKNYQCNPPVSRLATVRCSPEEMRELHYFAQHHVSVPDVLGTSSWEFNTAGVKAGAVEPSAVAMRRRPYSNRSFAYTILTTAENHGTRLRSVLRTWAKDANIPFIATDVVSPEELQGGRLVSLGEVGKHELGKKAMHGMAKMCEYVADFFVFVDDDCFVFTPNLEAEVSRRFSPHEPLYLGASLTHLKQPFASGGAGVVLSSETMRRFCERRNNTKSQCSPLNPIVWTKPGDTAMGDCMSEMRIEMTHHDGFHPLRLSDMVDYLPAETSCNVWWIPKFHKCRPPSSVTLTSHYTPQDRFAWYEFVSKRLIVRRAREFSDPAGGAWASRTPPRIAGTPAPS